MRIASVGDEILPLNNEIKYFMHNVIVITMS